MQTSRTEYTKMQSILNDTSFGYVQQEIIHIACNCLMCTNNVRPIPTPEEPRQTSPSEILIPPSESLFYLLMKCVNYRGIFVVPELIFLQEGTLFYTSDWGRLRMKDKLTNQEAKKFFDDRKQKARSSKNVQKQKESYILVYKTGTQQIMNEAHFNKIIQKRKNDPFWLDVVYSFKLPESKQIQPPLKTFTYKRTKSVAERMIPIMERIMHEIDNNQNKNREEGLSNNSLMSIGPDMQNSMINNNSLVSKNVSQQFGKKQLFANQTFQDNNQMLSAIFKTQKSKIRGTITIKSMVQEIVAYLQVSSKLRVLLLELNYTEVQMDPIIVHINKLLVCQIPPQEECYLHDRYKPLESIGSAELIELKKNYDKKDQQTLWNVCTEILQSCLEQRKIKLKITNYTRPTKPQLKQIFTKIFPNFEPTTMFQSINWKNQLPEFMTSTRLKINRMIESDEGISILKRFDIVFYRTF